MSQCGAENESCKGSSRPRSAQQFLSVHATIYNTFTIPHRLFRAEAFEAWHNAAGVGA
jgi:putative transposase